jgi:germination protein M
MKKMVALGIVFIGVGVSGCSFTDKWDELSMNHNQNQMSSMHMEEEEAKTFLDKLPIRLYFADEINPSKLKMMVSYIPSEEATQTVDELLSAVLRELFRGPKELGEVRAILPQGLELEEPPVFQDGVVILNFNQEFRSFLEGDASVVQLGLYSVVNALTEIRQVERVKFLVEGDEVDIKKGNLDMKALFHRNPNL